MNIVYNNISIDAELHIIVLSACIVKLNRDLD